MSVFAILIDELPICVFGRDEIFCSRPIDMDQHSIKNINRFHAVNKAYVDRVKYKTATGIIPNTVMTDRTLFTFLTAKAFTSGKIIICEIWVERMADEWIATSRPMCATEWPGFHKFSIGPSLVTFFSRSPTSDWTRNFRLDYIEQPRVSLYNVNRNIITLLIIRKK